MSVSIAKKSYIVQSDSLANDYTPAGSERNWIILVLLCQLSTASVCGSFARHSSAFSGLFQAL
jgi:hypothetical protein